MVKKRLTRKGNLAKGFALTAILTAALFVILGSAPLLADGKKKEHTNFMPFVSQPGRPTPSNTDALGLVNQIRSSAGVPQVNDLQVLNNNCFQHARYMAINNVISHEQDPNMPFSSEGGQICAENSNAWLGSKRNGSEWTPADSIDGWMFSVAHRLWLLYPTTEAVGYGFFTTRDENRAAAALDVLSYSNFEADKDYDGWPVRYPQESSYIPAERFPITLNWSYRGSKPVLEMTRVQTANGQSIAHDANTNLPARHRGIQIISRNDLPANSQIVVTVSGSYDGKSFEYTWTFYTGN